MTTSEFIPTYGTSHDPDELGSQNFEVGAFLRSLSGEYANAEVTLHPSNTDASLIISAIAYSTEKQRVSYRVSGGVKTNQALEGDGVTLRTGAYRIQLRLLLVDGRHYDRSAWLTIRDH